MSRTALMWFRRDLRLADNPALLEAVRAGTDGVVPLFVLDDRLWAPAGPARRAYLISSLADLSDRIGRLHVRRGDPVHEVLAAAQRAGAHTVHIAADYGPYGSTRDTAVATALERHGIQLVRTGSPYAVAPGRVVKSDGRPYSVYSPYARAWREHGWRPPVAAPEGVPWVEQEPAILPALPGVAPMTLPEPGEAAALRRWSAYLNTGLAGYDEARNRPDLDATSRMSVHLKWGEVHPRTLLADLARHRSKGSEVYRRELAWRDFYADVLWHHPESAREHLRPEFSAMPFEPPGPAFDQWCAGRTGFPIVDAGMRQLLAEGWMHNRVRMIVASFLVKDLHVEWQHGARHFMARLVDGDQASNAHGWQWVGGSGTDAAPYFRVFNPVTQAERFDPAGDYVRRYVPELVGVAGAAVHRPWRLSGGIPGGYPAPIVNHAEQRRVALSRYEAIRDP
ncbi:MAG: deoxyribodipyrimidine photo-lyase [Nocardioidaceae bacterium]|nr:deoxyribodipyrimidine photo-lyase [Nocardioidaceae bacterium]